MSEFYWIIDPGHGGVQDGKYLTSGKRSPKWPDGSQYFEGQGNRETAALLEAMLRENYIDYDFTVLPEDPRDIPLYKRTNKINNIYKEHKNAVVFSIHSNGASPQAHGYEFFTSPGQTKSDPLAEIFIKEFGKAFPELRRRSDSRDGDLDKEAKFWILTESDCPAVLAESMFHTNEKECKILMSSEGKRRVALAYLNAILRIEEMAKKGEI